MSKKITIICSLLIVHHVSAMSVWWKTHVSCYFAQGGEQLNRAEQLVFYQALFNSRHQQQVKFPSNNGRYDVIFFSEENTETQNPRVYYFINKIRGLVLIN